MSKRPQLGLLDDGMKRMASQVAMKDIPDLDKLMFANHLWHADGDETGRYALPGEINLDHKAVYRTTIAEYGSLDMPGVGRKRAIRYIGPRSGKFDKLVVHFPGFAHTHRYEDAQWYVKMLTRLTRGPENVAFVTINPVGRAVPGFDIANGSGSFPSRDKTIKDDDQVLSHVLEDCKLHTRDQVKLVISGHSLGTRLGREQAYKIAKNPKRYPVELTGLTLQASVGSKRWEDLVTLQYFLAIAPHIISAVRSGIRENLPGLDLSLSECQRLFYGPKLGSKVVCEIAASGLNAGGTREFLDNTLGRGDYEKLKNLRAFFASKKHTIGIHALVPKDDAIFHRSDDSIQRVARIVHPLTNVPHCFIVPGAEEELCIQVEKALRVSFGLSEHKKLGKR